MKNALWASTLLAGLLLVGCGPKSQTNGNVSATATANSVCPVGSWYSNGQCFDGNSSQAANGSLNNGFFSDNYSGYATLSISNIPKMKEFLKLGMGVCDRAANNYGQANCDSFIQGKMDIIMQLPSSNTGDAVVTVIARPYNDPYFNFYGTMPNARGLLGLGLGWLTGIYIPDPSYYTGATRNPLQIPMHVSPINNNQGFQVTGFGDYWTGLNQTMVTIQVLTGTVSSNNFTYKVLVGTQQVASGTMKRCQTVNCGL